MDTSLPASSAAAATTTLSSSSSVDDVVVFNGADPFAWLLALVGCVSLFLNVVVLTTLCKSKWQLRQRGSTALLLNLVVADLGITICGCPFAAVAAFYDAWIWGDVGCILYGFQGMLFGLASIVSLAALQFDRYRLTCCSSSAFSFLSALGGHRVVSTGVIWINAAFWSAAPAFGWHRYALEPSGVSCTIDYQRGKSTAYVTYLTGVFTFSYVVPLASMLFCEIRIRKQMSSCGVSSGSEAEKPMVEREKIKSHGFGTSTTFLGFVTVFLVCWTPYALLCIYAVFFDVGALPVALTKVAPVCAKMAGILNPLVYLTTVDKVKDATLNQLGFPNKKEN